MGDSPCSPAVSKTPTFPPPLLLTLALAPKSTLVFLGEVQVVEVLVFLQIYKLAYVYCFRPTVSCLQCLFFFWNSFMHIYIFMHIMQANSTESKSTVFFLSLSIC